MAVHPFRWQSKARLQQVRALLAARAGECLRGWAGAQAQLDIEPLGWAETIACERWYALHAHAGCLLVGVRRGAWEDWGTRLMSASMADGLGLAAGIGRRAASDVFRAAIGATPDCEFADADEPSPQATEPRFGAAEFQCRTPGLHARLVLDAALCEALVPRSRPEGEALTTRSQAVLQTVVALEALLDLGQTPLERTLGLRPGDVIKTAIALDGAIRLTAPSSATLACGALVSCEGRRALLCSNPTNEVF